MNTKASEARVGIPLFKREDFDGIVYIVMSNIASFIIIITALLSVGWSEELIFGRVIPGISVGMLCSGFYYSWMAYRMAKKENRKDVTALPYGLSTPALMVYLYSVIMPLQFGLNLSPEETWKCAMAATVLGGLIEAAGGFIGPFIRRHVPRTAMLATVAGISFAWMATVGLFEAYALPIIGIPCVVIGLAILIGGVNLPKKIKIPPMVLLMIIATLMGLALHTSVIDVSSIGHVTLPGFFPAQMASGFGKIVPVLVSIIPVEIYNFIETMDNVESAIAAGDNYNVKEAQIADGLCTAISGVFGGVAPNTVFIGHNGMKKSKCGIGHAWTSGLILFLCSILGVVQFLYYLIPPAFADIYILWIALIVLPQAFTDTPRRYGAAIVIGLIPHIADILACQTTAGVSTFGGELTQEITQSFIANGAMMNGIFELQAGGILTGMLWATITCMIIDRRFAKGAVFLVLCAVLTFFGLLHGGVIGFAVGDNMMVIGYLIGAAFMLLLHFFKDKLDIPRRYDYI